MTNHHDGVLQLLAVAWAFGAVLLAGTGTRLVGLAFAAVTAWALVHGTGLEGAYGAVVATLLALASLHAAALCRRTAAPPPDVRAFERDRPVRPVTRIPPRSWGAVPDPGRTDARGGTGVVVDFRPRRDLVGGRVVR